MSDHSFPITTDSATRLFPEELPDLKQPWTTLVTRTDDMAMTERPQGTRNNRFADSFEGEWLSGRPELMRMFPNEARLVPYFAGVTKEVSDEQVKEVPEGDTDFLPPAPWARPESVPVVTISGNASGLDLHAIAERMAQTNPGSNDGDTQLLLYTDLDDAKPFMTSTEMAAIREIERRYFPWRLGQNSNATFEVSAYANADTGVAVDLQRMKTTSKQNERVEGTATVNRAIDNSAITIKAAPGTKVLVSGLRKDEHDHVDVIQTMPESGELTVQIHQLTRRTNYGNRPPNRVGVLVIEPNETAGLPEVVDKVVLDLPERITDNVRHTAPDA